jgi:hypothetical protein
MLWLIFVILLVVWLLGVVASYTLGGLIHLLLALAAVVLLAQVIAHEKEDRGDASRVESQRDADESDVRKRRNGAA